MYCMYQRVFFKILANALEVLDGTNQEKNLKSQATNSIETEVDDEFENVLIFKGFLAKKTS